jgi:hypothetical protein
MNVVLNGYEHCKLCKGRGRDKYGERACPYCHGTGWANGRPPPAVVVGHLIGLLVMTAMLGTGAWFFLAWGLETAPWWWRVIVVAASVLMFGSKVWASRFDT